MTIDEVSLQQVISNKERCKQLEADRIVVRLKDHFNSGPTWFVDFETKVDIEYDNITKVVAKEIIDLVKLDFLTEVKHIDNDNYRFKLKLKRQANDRRRFTVQLTVKYRKPPLLVRRYRKLTNNVKKGICWNE